MAVKGYQWVRDAKGVAGFEAAKPLIERECQRIIAEVFKPRLGVVKPARDFNYVYDIVGSWHGKNFRFIQKYRTGTTVTPVVEFDSPFTRLEYYAKENYNLYFFRHTGKWWLLDTGLKLDEALTRIREDEMLQPYI
jgi:hypothetical protein